jgi:hypothetical protein
VHANEVLQFLTNQKESLELKYVGLTNLDSTQLKQDLVTAYETSLEKTFHLFYDRWPA